MHMAHQGDIQVNAPHHSYIVRQWTACYLMMPAGKSDHERQASELQWIAGRVEWKLEGVDLGGNSLSAMNDIVQLNIPLW